MTVQTAPARRRVDLAMTVEVRRVRRVAPHLARITLAGPEVDRFSYTGPDQLARIFLPPFPGAELRLPRTEQWWPEVQAMPEPVRPTVRNYTVRRWDPERGELDIDFVLHGDTGPASAWAGRAAVGDRIGVLSDGAGYAPPLGTDWQLLIGDETALPAVTSMVAALPPASTAIVLLEVGSAEDEIPVPTPPGVTLTWLHRGGVPAGSSDVVIRTLRALDLPAGRPYAWVAGESRMATTVRRHLCAERGMAKSSVYFCGYWKATGR